MLMKVQKTVKQLTSASIIELRAFRIRSRTVICSTTMICEGNVK
jgi:hypothetical protein